MLNRRFAASLRGSSTETYTKTAAIYHELSNVEKRIDHHIALLRTDEFKETECMGDIFRFVHQKPVTLPLYNHQLTIHWFGLCSASCLNTSTSPERSSERLTSTLAYGNSTSSTGSTWTSTTSQQPSALLVKSS